MRLLGQPNTSLAQAARELIVTDTETAAALAALLTDKLDVLKKVRARAALGWFDGRNSYSRPVIFPSQDRPFHPFRPIRATRAATDLPPFACGTRRDCGSRVTPRPE